MPRPSEEISRYNANSSGKPDANVANDALHLGGIPAEQFATERYVQNYYRAKEELLKEYIDSQDLAKLQEAKNYVDTMIRDQDFSSFAKLTDLQTLSQILTARIETYKIECQNELNAVVNDVNDNFNDVNGAISSLNNITNELFTSVSNGKGLVADAITDKGIHTSATDSFNTMATNISALDTSGGGSEYDENFVNTADGNAKANDILLGKIAYAKGQKIYGTHIDTDTSDATATENDILLGASAYVDGQKIYGVHEDLDTSDATATEDDILLGKTAYVNGQKLTGRSTIDTSTYPTYGTDTSGATATSADILYGKTAYARGQLLTGTLKNTEVEEIYAIDTVDEMDVDLFNSINTDPITRDTITERSAISYSKNGLFSVSATRLNNGQTQYIESYAVNENGYYILQSSGATTDTVITKKYRYTKSELGISDDETITDTAISIGGIDGNSDKAVLLITTKKIENNTTYCYCYMFTYHLSSNGVIGRQYSSENIINKKIILDIGNSVKPICLNNTNRTFYIIGLTAYSSSPASYKLMKIDLFANDISTTIYESQDELSRYAKIENRDVFITNDDKYIIFGGSDYGYSGGVIPFIYNDIENGGYTPILGTTEIAHSWERIITDSTNELFISTSTNNNINYYLKLSAFSINERNIPTISQVKSIEVVFPNDFPTGNGYFRYLSVMGIVGDKLLVQINYGYSSMGITRDCLVAIGTIDISNIASVQQVEIENVMYPVIGREESLFYMRPFINIDGSKYVLHNIQLDNAKDNRAIQVDFEVESNKLIGVKYRDKYFYNFTPQQLTAGQPDVRAGKTFIGWMGHPETGTMEVE